MVPNECLHRRVDALADEDLSDSDLYRLFLLGQQLLRQQHPVLQRFLLLGLQLAQRLQLHALLLLPQRRAQSLQTLESGLRALDLGQAEAVLLAAALLAGPLSHSIVAICLMRLLRPQTLDPSRGDLFADALLIGQEVLSAEVVEGLFEGNPARKLLNLILFVFYRKRKDVILILFALEIPDGDF